jgi:hypothetical protein
MSEKILLVKNLQELGLQIRLLADKFWADGDKEMSMYLHDVAREVEERE